MRPINGDHSEENAGGIQRPYLRFYHSTALRTRTLSVLDALEAAHDATNHRAALAQLVLDLTESGLDYYFVKPVEVAKVGFVAERSTKLGIAGILRAMGPVTRGVIGRMDAGQLRVVSTHLRHLME